MFAMKLLLLVMAGVVYVAGVLPGQHGYCYPHTSFKEGCNWCHCNGDGTYASCTYKACHPERESLNAVNETNGESETPTDVDGMKQIADSIATLQSTLDNVRGSMEVFTNITREILQTSSREPTDVNVVCKSSGDGQPSRATPVDGKQIQATLIDREPSLVTSTDCAKLKYIWNVNISGVYMIRPRLVDEPFYVYCDMTTDDGGWTVIQNRFEGKVDFERNWQHYKNGFGNLNGEFWLGLEKIHQLTDSELNELRIDLWDFSFDTRYAKYESFNLGPESKGYPLSYLGKYTGTAGDSLTFHVGRKFSTYDRDNDRWEGNCAENNYGAWWYDACLVSNLNGKYLRGDVETEFSSKGICWYKWHGAKYSLMKTRLMIRPKIH